MGEAVQSHIWRVCYPWWLRHLDEFEEHPRGANCESCGRDIAVEREWSGRLICIYCAIERGWVEDGPIGERFRPIYNAAEHTPTHDSSPTREGV